ncbi:Apoptosis-inducing factor [Phytophthora megakarya]|uniref:Apoptosis-inducing factor n=1 Tax=Phytophthora megakarya TaxID=4795 RepID=A0A225VX10_9STRA|nr:Apoptosis-inducing factor [Phytophthora megakarya]
MKNATNYTRNWTFNSCVVGFIHADIFAKTWIGINDGNGGHNLTVGPNGGVTQIPMLGRIVMGNWVTRTIKSKDYFAGRICASIGLQFPK